MARGLSFFYRRNQLSAEIRGKQVAEFVGGKQNPVDGYQHDVCILIKMLPGRLAFERGIHDCGPMYLDLVDHSTCLNWLARNPALPVIVSSRSGMAYLSETLAMPNPLTFIPQHHCNVERVRRPHRPVRVVGYVGVDHAVTAHREKVTAAVEKMGLEMRWCTEFYTREDVVKAYQQIDIQFTWREGMPEKLLHLKNPLKIVNAASFGIPTVANSEPSFLAECRGRFVPALTIDDAIEQIDLLRGDANYYESFAEVGLALAEPYHLERVADLYRGLTRE